MAEWLKAAVLKTVVPSGTGGSNPSLSANRFQFLESVFFIAFHFYLLLYKLYLMCSLTFYLLLLN